MAEDLGTAVLQLRTDSSNLNKGLDDAKSKGSKAFSAIKTAAKVAAVGGIVALGFAVHDVVGDFLDGQKASAQTAAVLKSTGGAAGVTQKQVEGLATKIRNYSGIQDDTVQSGENMLLTFTNIKNGTGKNNQIFTQSTKTLADMSVALGEDMPKAAIQLGKALNDPIKGVTALKKVGVTFDAQQMKTITTMVKAGNIAGAQTVILKELHKEFGGSAAAAGQTLGGQLSILRGRLEDVSEQIISKLLPYVKQFITWVNNEVVPAVRNWDHWLSANLIPTVKMLWGVLVNQIIPAIQKWYDIIVGKLLPIVQSIFNFLASHMDVTKSLAVFVVALAVGFLAWQAALVVAGVAAKAYSVIQAALNLVMDANPIALIVIALAALAAGFYYAYQNSATFRTIVNQVFKDLKLYAQDALNWINNTGLPALRQAWATVGPFVVNAVHAITTAIQTMVTWIRSNWQQIWSWLGPVVTTALSVVKTYINTGITEIKNIINTAGDVLHGRWSNIWNDLKNLVTTPIHGMITIITTLITGLGPLLLRLGGLAATALVTGLTQLIQKIPGWAASAASSIETHIKSAMADAGVWLFQAGRDLVNGLVNGIESKAADAVNEAKHLASSVVSAAAGVFKWNSPSKVFYDMGSGTVEGLMTGIKNNSAKAEQAAKVMAANTIKAAQGPLQAAQATLSDDLSKAFDAKQSNALTPAEQQLQDLEAQHDSDSRDQALADAQKALADAQKVDPDTGLTDPAAILAAQQQLADAKYQITVASLTATATAQRTALNASQTVAQQGFDASLAALNGYLGSAQTTAAGAATAISNFMGQWGISIGDIGNNLGNGFVLGINNAQKAVIDSVTKLAAAIKKALKTGLAIHSPSRWSRDEVGAPLVQGIVRGIQGQGDSVSRALRSTIPNPGSLMPKTKASGAGGGNHIELTQHFNETPASADPVAIGAVTSWSLRTVAV